MKKNYFGMSFISLLLILTGAGCSLSQSSNSNNTTTSPSSSSNSTQSNAFSYSVFNLKFQSPVALSSPEDIGAQPGAAYSFTIKNQSGAPKFEVVFTLIPDGVVRGLGGDTTKITIYAKSTFMGSAEPADQTVSRAFFGQTINGGREATTIPAPSTLESYLVTLPSNHLLFVGFKYTNEMPANQADAIISNVASTLEE